MSCQSLFTFCRDRLSASDMLQVRKVMEHVYEKIINLDNESQTTSSSNNEKAGEQEKEEDIAVLAEEKIELLCQDQVRHSGIFSSWIKPASNSQAVVNFWVLRWKYTTDYLLHLKGRTNHLIVLTDSSGSSGRLGQRIHEECLLHSVLTTSLYRIMQ